MLHSDEMIKEDLYRVLQIRYEQYVSKWWGADFMDFLKKVNWGEENTGYFKDLDLLSGKGILDQYYQDVFRTLPKPFNILFKDRFAWSDDEGIITFGDVNCIAGYPHAYGWDFGPYVKNCTDVNFEYMYNYFDNYRDEVRDYDSGNDEYQSTESN